MSASHPVDFLHEIARYRSPNRFLRQAYEEAGRRLSPQEAVFFSDEPDAIQEAVRHCLNRQLRISRDERFCAHSESERVA